MLHISNKSLNPSSLITPLSFGEGSGVRLFVLSGLCFNLNQPSPQDYSCRFEIFVFVNYQTTEPS